jgi:dTDP-4-dehydrorhamnose reductase
VKVLLIGGSGQLGKSLLGLSSSNAIELISPTSKVLNVSNFQSVSDFINEVEPECIINASAWTDVQGAERDISGAMTLNATAVEHLTQICKRIGASLVHISTDYVFDGEKGAPYLENDPVHPLNTYGKSKLAGEETVAASELEKYFIIRTSWLYSRYGKNFVKTIAQRALSNERCSITDDQFGSPTFAGDLASAILALVQNPPSSGIYHYSNSGTASWFEFGCQIYSELGIDQSFVAPRSTESSELPRPRFSTLDLSKWAKENLSNIYSWQESLHRELPSIVAAIEKEKN